MNKKVIALAVAGALASPLAAQAQTANVTMYGTFRVALESTDLEDVGRNNRIDSWSSRWGIRGIESLGGGLNGIFQLETGINMDSPGGAVVDFTGGSVRYQVITIREAWVGLNGGFGTVKMGSGLTPWDDIMGLDHLLLANGFEGMTTLGGGSSINITRSGGFTNYGAVGPVAVSNPSGAACNDSTNFDARYGSSVRYDSPNFSGLTFATQFAFLGENSTGYKCKGWDSMVLWKNMGIELGAAYASHMDFRNHDGDSWIAHAAYDFGFLQVTGQYQYMKYEGTNGASGEAKVGYWNIGTRIPLGPGVLTFQYHDRDKGAVLGPLNVREVDDGGGRHFSVSYKYGFSKRTYVYGWGAQVRADDGASIEGGPLGGKATSFGFGMQHNF